MKGAGMDMIDLQHFGDNAAFVTGYCKGLAARLRHDHSLENLTITQFADLLYGVRQLAGAASGLVERLIEVREGRYPLEPEGAATAATEQATKPADLMASLEYCVTFATDPGSPARARMMAELADLRRGE